MLWAGRDEVAGGTWLGVSAHGMVVGVTNRRTGENDPARPSRGLLCLDVLRQESPLEADRLVAHELAARSYNPFNLQCADPHQGWVRDGQGKRWELAPGAHVLANYGDLDDPSIPVVHRAQMLLQEHDLRDHLLDRLLQTLGRICADQESDPPICRVGGDYGTVSSSLIAVRADGSVAAYWHAPGPPAAHAYQPLDLERSPLVHSH